MPEPVEPAPQSPEPRDVSLPTPDRRDGQLTTASLARAADVGAAESTRSFASAEAADEQPEPLFADEETSRLRADWDRVQASFVDEPRAAVESADRLVATAIKRMAEIFAQEKAQLEGQWDRGGDVSTEDLRQALRRYRAFFGRVLSV
jgi:hypothetical protein